MRLSFRSLFCCGLGRDFNDDVRRGKSSCCLTDPIPNDASSAGRSKGEEANSVDEGDMSPKASAGSASGVGLRGVMANSSERGDATSVGVAEPDSSRLSSGNGGCFDAEGDEMVSGSTTFSSGTTGTTLPEVFTYAVPGLTALMALARWPAAGLSLVNHGLPEGAEEGPRLSAASVSAGSAVAPAERGMVPFAGADGKARLHSLNWELGVMGVMPRLPGSKPPFIRLDLNSCSCMIRFMLGPIHLLLFSRHRRPVERSVSGSCTARMPRPSWPID